MSTAAIQMGRTYRPNESISGGYLPPAVLRPVTPSLYLPGPQLPARPASPRKGGRALRGRSPPELPLDLPVPVLRPDGLVQV
jgi:hypothetical protein